MGWRPNNDLTQEVANFYAQWAVVPELNLQAEYISKSSEWGDLAFNWDPNTFTNNTRTERDSETWRLGGRYSWSPQSTLVVSYVNNELDDNQVSEFQLSPIAFGYLAGPTQSDGEQWEAQYIYQTDEYNVTAGLANYDIERERQRLQYVEVNGSLLNPPGVITLSNTTDGIDQPRGYLYANIKNDALVWTIGASYDDYEEADFSSSSFNPKFGVRWQPRDDLELRAAAFKVLKPALVSNRTIEPTQVAGFNQFFDDANGTKSSRYGLAADWRLNTDINLGAEATWRDIESPVLLGTTWFEDDYDEEHHSLRLNWTATDRLAVTAAAVYDRFESGLGIRATSGNPIPTDMETFSLPVALNYASPSGLFGTLGATYVNQDVERVSTSTLQGDDDFVLVDAAIGFRLPDRYGVVSLGVRNLFDEEFNYQDDSFRAFGSEDPYRSPFVPERVMYGSLTLSF
jgi:hypothetical protein